MPCDGRASVLGWCWIFVPWEPNQHFPSLLVLKLAVIILHAITYNIFAINCRDNGSMVCFLVIYLLNYLYLVLGDGMISCFGGFFLHVGFSTMFPFICLLFSDVYKNVHCHGPVVYPVYFFLFFCVLYHIIAISSHDVSNDRKIIIYMKRNKHNNL